MFDFFFDVSLLFRIKKITVNLANLSNHDCHFFIGDVSWLTGFTCDYVTLLNSVQLLDLITQK